MTTATIQPGTEQAQLLQNAIQNDLIARGYATEGDEVMAEFVLVMLANQKTPEQITVELTDLIGPDYESAFTDWLFRTVATMYAPTPSPRPSQQRIETVDDSTEGRDRFRGIRGAGAGLRTNRVTPYDALRRSSGSGNGMDLDPQPMSGGRARGDAPAGAPTGPKRGVLPQRPQSIFDRVNLNQRQPVYQAPAPAFIQGNGSTHYLAGQIGHAVQQMSHPGYGQAPMAYAPHAFVPPPFQSPQHFSRPPPQQRPPPPLPTRPLSEAICKFGLKCRNAWCADAHPSPAASPESGLVLSSDACPNQLSCQDADCPKSHVSRQGKDAASSLPPPKASAQPAFDAMNVDGPQSTQKKSVPCKFGNACTRQGCYYTHPWETGPSKTACRYGASCTRADCHFSHPTGRAIKSKNKTMTFDASGQPTSSSLGSPAATDAQMSERLRRFAAPTNGDVERIIPGDTTTTTAATAVPTTTVEAGGDAVMA